MCRRELIPRSFIQLLKILPVKLTETYHYLLIKLAYNALNTNLGGSFFKYMTWWHYEQNQLLFALEDCANVVPFWFNMDYYIKVLDKICKKLSFNINYLNSLGPLVPILKSKVTNYHNFFTFRQLAFGLEDWNLRSTFQKQIFNTWKLQETLIAIKQKHFEKKYLIYSKNEKEKKYKSILIAIKFGVILKRAPANKW